MIPRGTGWDFVRTYGIPHKLDGAIDVAPRRSARASVDLGRALYRAWDGSDAESYFANVASAGMSGAIAERANQTTKALGGKVSYLWATVAVFSRWQNSEIRALRRRRDPRRADARRRRRERALLRRRHADLPDAEPDDGLFDVLTIGDLTKRDLLTTLPKTFWGKHLPHPKAELLRGRRRHRRLDGAAADRARRRAAGHDAGPLRDRAARAARRACPPELGVRRRLLRRRGLLGRGGLLQPSPPSRASRAASPARRPAARARRRRAAASASRPDGSRLWWTASRSRSPPGRFGSFCSASSLRSATRERMSFGWFVAMSADVSS